MIYHMQDIEFRFVPDQYAIEIGVHLCQTSNIHGNHKRGMYSSKIGCK